MTTAVAAYAGRLVLLYYCAIAMFSAVQRLQVACIGFIKIMVMNFAG